MWILYLESENGLKIGVAKSELESFELFFFLDVGGVNVAQQI